MLDVRVLALLALLLSGCTCKAPASGPPATDIRNAVLQIHTMCTVPQCTSGLPPGGQVHRERAPAVMWSQQIAASSSVHVPARSDVTLYGVIFDGTVAVGRGKDGSDSRDLTRMKAFQAVGSDVLLRPRSGGARLVLALVTDGAPLAMAAPRPGGAEPIQVIDFNTTEELTWAGGKMHARIGFETGRASLQLMTAAADAGPPPHQHADAWEIIGMLRADGEHGEGPDLARGLVSDRSVIAIPPATQHAWYPSGKSEMVALQLYVPPGPEQRFKSLGKNP